MSAFYSILYVPIRPGVQERLTVGLFMRTHDQAIFRYSTQKLGALKELLPRPSYNLLKLALGNIERSAVNAVDDFEGTKTGLLPDNSIYHHGVNESYFEYMSRYNKNLISFSKPEKIENASFELFHKLFSKYVSDELLTVENSIEKRDVVLRTRTQLKQRIETRVNWDFKVTENHFSKLILPTINIDFIGKNDEYVAGQAVNFEKAERFLDNDVAKFIALIDAMRDKSAGSKCFVLGKEPERKIFPTQHKLWSNIRESNKMEFVDADEFEKVASYVEGHDVQPLIPFTPAE